MIQIGLLWYDNSAQDLSQKLARAIQRYQARFGAQPNVCYVHPTAMPEGEPKVRGLRVAPSANILRHHFWLGQEQKTG